MVAVVLGVAVVVVIVIGVCHYTVGGASRGCCVGGILSVVVGVLGCSVLLLVAVGVVAGAVGRQRKGWGRLWRCCGCRTSGTRYACNLQGVVGGAV